MSNLEEYKKVEKDIMNLFGYWKSLKIEDLLPKDRGLIREITQYVMNKLNEKI